MDEGAAAITEDGGEGRPHGEDDTHQNYRQAKGTDGRVGVHCSQDYGEAFREEAPDLEHQQHQKKHTLVDDHSDTTTDAEAGVTDQLPQCQTERKDGENFSQEANAETGGEITKRHAFECSHCGKSYGMIGHFLNHQRKHTKAPKSLSQDLEDLKKKSFQCEFCGRNYSRASALEAHLRCHEEKLVKPRNRDLEESPVTEETVIDSKPNKNQTLDTPDKPFTCACGKAFTAQMGLKTHQRFSRNSRCSPEDLAEKTKKPVSEFNCSECKKTFSSNIAFLNHQRWHANRSMNSSKRIPCEECGKVFMTLTFYHRHQRLVHSSETPAKSFLHQVCQLQKKAFECKECGLKFSRASALHSHELHHTDIFKETKKVAPPRSVSLNQQKSWESSAKDGEQEEAPPVHPVSTAEDVDADDTDGEECYGPGDFNVQVISASESEDEATQHANPDLELLCESDREAQDDDVVSPSAGVSKPKMDLKIVQIDLNTADAEDVAVAKETEVKKAEERFDCPDCSLWFSSAASLRIHRMWHDVRKRRQQTQAQQAKHTCQECGLEFTCPELFNTHLHLHALKEEGEDSCPRLDDDDDCDGDDETGGTDTGGGAGDSWEMSAKKSVALLSTASINGKVRNVYSCLVCGKVYTYQVPFLKHQLQHKLNSMAGRSRKSGRYECSICGVTFIRKERLRIHTRLHTKVETRRELLGPELHQCDQCGRTFSSTRTWAAHMELHKQHLFWCLSCSRGFPDEIALDKHLQGHNRKQHTCKICRKGFAKVTELEVHYKTHTAAKVYHCTMCSKSFSFLGNLILHRSKHLRVFPGGDARVNKRSSKGIFRKGQFPLNRNEKQGRNEPEAAEEGNVDSEGSDCGEPTHQSNRLSSVAPTAGQELGTEAGGAHVQREHKYWEWDCCVCDMGFDEVGKLHLHYVKHATGELPIPQEYI